MEKRKRDGWHNNEIDSTDRIFENVVSSNQPPQMSSNLKMRKKLPQKVRCATTGFRGSDGTHIMIYNSTSCLFSGEVPYCTTGNQTNIYVSQVAMKQSAGSVKWRPRML